MNRQSSAATTPNRLGSSLQRKVLLGGAVCGLVVTCWLFACTHVATWTATTGEQDRRVADKLTEVARQISRTVAKKQTQPAFTPLIAGLNQDFGLAEVGVCDSNGRVVAHSRASRVGETVKLPTGEQLSGPVQVAKANREDHRQAIYFVSCAHAPNQAGHLFAIARQTTPSHDIGATINQFSWYLVVPMLVVGLTTLFTARLVTPVTAIDQQLRQAAQAAHSDDISLERVGSSTAAGTGWNRIVDATELWHEYQQAEVTTNSGDDTQQTVTTLESLPMGVVCTDGNGTIQHTNQAALAMLTPTRPLQTGEQLLTCLDIDGEQTPKHPFLETPVERPATCEYQTAVSSDRCLRIVRRPHLNDAGERVGLVWSLQDISQQKLAEQMRDKFLDTATHELRTPLANLKAYAETLTIADEIDVEQQKEFCNIINQEATRLARFVDDLLNVSSLEVGGLDVSRQKCELDRLLDFVCEAVTPQMVAKNISFHTDFPKKLPELILDKDKFSAVLVNLLGNAAKYTPENGRVDFKLRISEKDIEFLVEDTGVGIRPEELPRVFDRFFRSDDPRVQDQSGTGIGLSLAQEVARLHGGEVKVQSEYNVGSTFIIHLPAEETIADSAI